ncbi:MAG: CHAT domain-containing protein, partial [Microcystis aeruginosa]
MNPKFYALLTLSLVATVTLPVVNGKLPSLVPAVIAQNTDGRKAEADQLLQLCRQNLDNNQVKLAIQSCQQAVIAYRQIKDLSGEAKSTANLGNAYVNDGQYRQAISVLENAVKIAQESKERRVEALAFLYLGGAYYELGEFKESIEFFQQTLTIAKEIKDADLEKSAEKLLVLMEAEKQRKEADKLFEQGVQQYEISQFREALQSWEKALQIYQEIKNRQGEAASLDNLGSAYLSLGQYQKAIDHHQENRAIARKIGDLQGEALSLNNLGVAYRDNKQPAEAITNLEASLNIYLDMRGGLLRDHRKDFLASNEGTVITLATILIEQNQPEKAFQWLNLATTADLADYNRLIDAKVADPDAQKALDNWNADNRQLEGMRRQLQDKFSEELAQQIRQFEEKVYKNAETIGQKYPEIAELFETKPTDIAQLQKNIAPDTLVIQPVLLGNKATLFLITRDKLTVIQSDAKADDFNQLVSEYRNQLADYQNSDFLVTGSKLYEILIRPIESQIAASSRKNIAIIATGQLRYIPFETLYDKKTKQYLLEKYPIYYLTRISTSSLATQKTKTDRSTLKALALANPKPFL